MHPLDLLRRKTAWAWLLAPLAAFGCGAAPSQAEPAAATAADAAEKADAPGEKWVRLLEDEQGEPIALETAIVRYVKKDDFVAGKAPDKYKEYVDLVGAVHIGDKRYYRNINRRFKGYDSVLYELVAPEGTKVPRGRGTSNAHPLGALQNGMKSMLEVEHQLEQVDYTQDNMVHADLSPDQFMESMAAKEEGFLEMYFKLLGASMAQQSQAAGATADVDIMAAMFATDRARQLKIALAKQFEGMEALMTGFSGPEGSTLITARNERALEVLQERLDAGDRKLAIFYGAGHLAEMDQQLEEDFDMVPVSVEWLEAWDLRQ
ncbi:hypothetical protein PLANPX_4155 [Lacipirellula parvula]|uniref:TraB/GumN family protein n=2 Tax=Lacipirellula parvula TaxID=2650471 RepID=A0A5K7XJW9_9BACT|nr:hypothetical protein PLANPX_4155 [Lacipirellula parvula]